MLHRIFVSAATWAGLGLASGLYYREFTKSLGFHGFTQLALAHTHALALGTLFLLILLALAKSFALPARSVSILLLLWNIGLGITFGMQVIKGSLQVLAHPMADSAALAGIAGLGHITLTIAFVYLFMVLAPAVKAQQSAVDA